MDEHCLVRIAALESSVVAPGRRTKDQGLASSQHDPHERERRHVRRVPNDDHFLDGFELGLLLPAITLDINILHATEAS